MQRCLASTRCQGGRRIRCYEGRFLGGGVGARVNKEGDQVEVVRTKYMLGVNEVDEETWLVREWREPRLGGVVLSSVLGYAALFTLSAPTPFWRGAVGTFVFQGKWDVTAETGSLSNVLAFYGFATVAASCCFHTSFGQPFQLFGQGEHHESELAILGGLLAELLVQRMLFEHHQGDQGAADKWTKDRSSMKDQESSSSSSTRSTRSSSSKSSGRSRIGGGRSHARNSSSSSRGWSKIILDEELLGRYRYLQETRWVGAGTAVALVSGYRAHPYGIASSINCMLYCVVKLKYVF